METSTVRSCECLKTRMNYERMLINSVCQLNEINRCLKIDIKMSNAEINIFKYEKDLTGIRPMYLELSP